MSMSACDVNMSVSDWLGVPVREISGWLDVLNERQKELERYYKV